MELHKNNVPVYEFTPSYGGRNIVVSIDSSKSNTAMFVWDEYGHPLDDYEISGAGSEVDIYDLCWQTRKELKKLFTGANIILVGIEDIITKKEKGYKGLDFHQSRYKITAVFDSLIFFFQDNHNITPMRINNWSWKSSVLPEELRKADVKKGSQLYCKLLGNRWADRKDDVTDAYCIGLYLFMTVSVNSVYTVDSTVPFRGLYEYAICPIDFPTPANSKKFVIQNEDSLIHNIETVAGRIKVGQPGCITVECSKLTIDDVYSDKVQFSGKYSYERNCDKVLVVVFRKE